jgi:CTP:phosphocholine cytidylyltransferase-like protein
MIFDSVLRDKYEEVYSSVYSFYKNKTDVDIFEVQRFLEDMYIYDGNNWTGRSEIRETINNATIAALQRFISEYKEAMEKSDI